MPRWRSRPASEGNTSPLRVRNLTFGKEVVSLLACADSGPVTVGKRVGSYEILGLLGAGGMGEVYRARDTKLKREVALKVLPEAFACDPERLARFTREAEVLAALKHPNIASIYGAEESALVMELVQGDTLAEITRRGPLPLETANEWAASRREPFDVQENDSWCEIPSEQ